MGEARSRGLGVGAVCSDTSEPLNMTRCSVLLAPTEEVGTRVSYGAQTDKPCPQLPANQRSIFLATLVAAHGRRREVLGPRREERGGRDEQCRELGTQDAARINIATSGR